MGIVAKCPISLKMTPLKGKGFTSPMQFLSPNLSGLHGHWHCRACLRTLKLSIKNLPAVNSGVRESFKKTGNGGKSSFWSPPVSLGSTKFSKICIACTTYSKFPYPFNSNIVFIV